MLLDTANKARAVTNRANDTNWKPRLPNLETIFKRIATLANQGKNCLYYPCKKGHMAKTLEIADILRERGFVVVYHCGMDSRFNEAITVCW